MSNSETGSEAVRAADRLLVQAAWPAAIVGAGLIAAPHLLSGASAPLISVSLSVAVLAALAVLALSSLTLFDAMLFRVIASHDTVEEGCREVDDLLARMRLKPKPIATRPLADRIRGAGRILARQRGALALFVLAGAAAAHAAS